MTTNAINFFFFALPKLLLSLWLSKLFSYYYNKNKSTQVNLRFFGTNDSGLTSVFFYYKQCLITTTTKKKHYYAFGQIILG